MGTFFDAACPRTGRRIAWWTAVAGLVLGSAVVLAADPSNAAAVCSAKSKPDRESALTLARECKMSVAVSGATTATSTLAANSNGSLTVTESMMPERVRRADGTWVPVDTTLRVNGDGTISPVASPTAVILSGGGAGFLAKTAHDAQELVWTWPGHTLPKPVLSKDVATYPSVLPDVDLKVRVDEWGFSEVLVVKTATSAASPELASLRFALSGSALTPAALAGTATTPAQAVTGAFEIGAAYMWDSTMPATIPAGMPAVDVQSELTSSIDGPGSAAKVQPMTLGMAGTTLVVTPAQSLLTDRTAKFPIFIDPKSTSPARSYWAMINSEHPAQQYWTFDRDGRAKVGNAGDGNNMYRSLFQFNTATWKGKHVTDVTFADNLVHSWNGSSCANTVTELHLSSQQLGSSTTWNTNAASWGGSLATVNNQNCQDAANVASEWHSASLTSAINAARNASFVTVGLRQAVESTSGWTGGWKKFDETSGSGGAHLSVTYNTTPVLSSLHTDAAACASSAGSAPALATVGSHNPVPQVTVSDGETDKSTVTFTYPKVGGGTSSTAYTNVASGASQKLVAGIPATAVPTGGTYSWTVTVSDGTDSATATCYFKVDNTVPAPPSVVTADGLYPDDGVQHGGVGKPGRFTIAATGPDASKVVKYVWGPTTGGSQRTVTTTAGAAVTVLFTPPVVGDNTLQAYAYTSAGVVSAQGSFDFQVATPSPLVGEWPLTGDGADIGGSNPATAANVTWTPNARQIGQSAAHLNGTSSMLSAGVPMHTNNAFAVSAWLRPTGTGCEGTAVSQDGTHNSGFVLGCYGGKFRFSMMANDDGVTSAFLLSTNPAPIGLWTNVVGVYDPSAAMIYLYVNSVLQGSAALSGSWDAAGPFVIGRERYLDAANRWWSGDISDVRAWDRVIYSADLAALSPSSWADQFPLADPTRNTIRDNVLTWTGAPAPTVDDMNPPGSGGTPAVLLNNADTVDSATSATPSVRTDGSFSVSAWVNPTSLPGGNRSVIAQNGTTVSAFSLGISANKHYMFRRNLADVVGPSGTVVEAPETPVVGQWVHLIGTFDFTSKQMTLYVNGVQKGTPQTFAGTPWHAGGPLMVGAALWNGVRVDSWIGGVDYVSTFNGVLTAGQIQNLYLFNDPYYAP